ncbi:Ribosomal protein S18 acetylase RimI [Sphingomonas sp. YR710]|uniref:GNAT family N-acetyltransferase n=1 Tax=Sphingomonas sp. YR710 TaxID=1882773 RepID=UPI00088DED62|nr:GNAT family N-acetyltransferase [Sphingomonas sp. YR710]SDD89842.1 Ribosomal protein S18 acetylase RimI [Sphingomonas sp. YR710]
MQPLNLDCPPDALPRRDWSATLTTRTGFSFPVRPVQPGDEAALADFFKHVTPEDLRFRFLSGIKQVSGARLVEMTHVDHKLTEHFVAFDPSHGGIIASAMLAADDGRDKAEVAVSIDARYKNRGIGWMLLGHVARYARAHGIKRLQSIERRENHAAIELEHDIGFTARPYPGDNELVLVEAELSSEHTDTTARPSLLRTDRTRPMLSDILALVDGAAPTGAALDVALTLAQLHHAHLGVTVLTERFLIFGDPMGLYSPAYAGDEDHRAQLAAVRARMADAPIWVDVRGYCEDPAVLPGVANVEGRLADLVLIGANEDWSDQRLRRRVAEACLLGARVPILLPPSSWQPAPIRHAVLGWNGSAEAAQAAKALIAIAEPGAQVYVVIVDAGTSFMPGSSAPGNDIVRHLACHGLIADIVSLASKHDDEIEVLLQQETLGRKADLLVVGGYGHSRFRETLMGGTTRKLIENSAVPVLMAH